MDNLVEHFKYYKDKNVFLTGHTGFKGTWMSEILTLIGANVTGYSLESPTNPSLYNLCGIDKEINSVIGDIRNKNKLEEAFNAADPEIVFHLAAQPLVRESYNSPVYTYETNVMGTVNLLECIRKNDSVKTVVNITTDKVYENKEWIWGYRENEPLNGYDPYSNSKSCSELVTNSYKLSFLNMQGIAVSTARAGNVIGGGDFSADRIIPDCIRAMEKKQPIIVRNPHSIRPYQHVLEPLFAYLMIGEAQVQNSELSDSYNVGPDDENCVTTGFLADMFCDKWGGQACWEDQYDGGPHEANFLKLDCSKIKNKIGWKPIWGIDIAVEKTIEWTKSYLEKKDINQCMDLQIEEYMNSYLNNK